MENLSNVSNSPAYGALLRDSRTSTTNISISDKVSDKEGTGFHCLDPKCNCFATKGICSIHDLMFFPDAMNGTSYRSCLHYLSKDSACVHDSLADYDYSFKDYLPDFFLSEGVDDYLEPDLVTSCKGPAPEMCRKFAESYGEDMNQAENSDKDLLFNINRNKEPQHMNTGLNKIQNQLCNVQERIQDDHKCMVEPDIDLRGLLYLSPVYSIKVNKGKQSADVNCYSPVYCSEENIEDGCTVQYIASSPGNTRVQSTYFETPYEYACAQSSKEESQTAAFETPDKKLCRGEYWNYGAMAKAFSTFQEEEDSSTVQGSPNEFCLPSSPNSRFSRRMSIHLKGYSSISKPDLSLCPQYLPLSPDLTPTLWNTGNLNVHEVKTSGGRSEVHTQGTYETMCPCSSPTVYYPKQKPKNQSLDVKDQSQISKSEQNSNNGSLLEKLKQASDVNILDKHSAVRYFHSAIEEKSDSVSNQPLKTPIRRLTYRKPCLNSVPMANNSFNASAKEESLCSFLAPASSANGVHQSSPSSALPKSISVRLKGLSPKVKTVFPLCSGNQGHGGKNINEGVCEIYSQGTYKTELCNKWESMNSNCPYGENCRFAHGLEELRIVARHCKYKTQVCRMVSAGEECRYGHRCHFRHALKEDE